MCSLTFISKDDKANNYANEILNELKAYNFKVLGVSELLKIRDEKRYRIVVKSKSFDQLQQVIYELYQKHRLSRNNVKLHIDMNPLTMDD